MTFSPSTTMTTGSVSVSPTSVATLSISMTSPTATFCWVAPARTIAYTAVSFVDSARSVWVRAGRAPLVKHRGQGVGRSRGMGTPVMSAHRGSIVRTRAAQRKTEPPLHAAYTAENPESCPSAALGGSCGCLEVRHRARRQSSVQHQPLARRGPRRLRQAGARRRMQHRLPGRGTGGTGQRGARRGVRRRERRAGALARLAGADRRPGERRPRGALRPRVLRRGRLRRRPGAPARPPARCSARAFSCCARRASW